MKNCKYMRKIGFAIIICLTVFLTCALPAAAFAEGSAAPAERESVHFIAPTAITVVGGYLYVADNIEENKCAIICFDASEANPEPKYTFVLDMNISGLSNNGSDIIYAFWHNIILELHLRENDLPQIATDNYILSSDVNIIDVAYGRIPNTQNDTVYALTENALYQYSSSTKKFNTVAGLNSLKNAAGCLSYSNVETSPFYYIHTKDSVTTCNRIYLNNNSQDTAFETKLHLNGFAPKGLFDINGKVALYDDTSVCTLEESSANITALNTLTLNELYGTDCKISDVSAYGDRIFILNTKNQIDIFDKKDDAYDTVNYSTIGSDTVDKAVPTAFTSFTLVRPKGYPANIVYKTNDEATSIEKIYTEATEYDKYIILGYDGDTYSNYYYVMIGDKFGWVKKNNGAAATPENDDKLTVINNRFSNELFDYETKFISLNSIYVYDLPLANSHKTAISQTASQMKTIKVLQYFNEGEQVWYYVSYDDNARGFVRSQDVGMFHISAKNEIVTTQGLKKINSSLFSAVNLYATAELSQQDKIADETGKEIKLYSGDRVTLIETEGDAAFVMVLHNDGAKDFGWVEASRLINVHQITTNTIVGLSLLAFAVALAAILLTVYFKRKKKIKANKE